MRLIQQTPTRLVAQNSPFGIWLGCVFLLLIGLSIFAVPTSSSDEHLLNQVYAYSFITLGLITSLTSGRFTMWMFDKSENSFQVRSRILFIITTNLKYSLTEIDKVEIESKLTENGDYTFGIKVLLTERSELQLCPGFNLLEFMAKEGVRRISSFLNSSN